MTENYKDFLNWATPQLTVDQYQTLCKILYSFKKYRKTDIPAVFAMGKFKDEAVAICGHFPHFFSEMGKLVGEYPKQFFETWYNDNVIFWPYKETPDLVESRERLMKKCESHTTYYRFIYVFRENQHGEITCFNIVNKCYAGSPLHRCDLEKYINTLWFKPLNNITPYKFDETILYRLFGYIHRYKKTIEVLGQPYHKAGHNTILEYMVYIIKHLSAEGKLKEVK